MRFILVFAAFYMLSGCVGVFRSGSTSVVSEDSGPDKDVDVSHVKNAVPRLEPITRAGNKTPYKVLGKTYRVDFNSKGFSQKGRASWYGRKFHGRKTANGETYDMYAMTAAHKTLPIPSYVRVTNLDNKHWVVVRVNDRGPFHDNRVIDLSYAAAKKLGIQQAGTGNVRVDIVTPKALSSAPSTKTTSDTYIQVGAFRKRSGAIELQKKVAKVTQQRVIVAMQAKPNAKYYKVLIGPVRSQSSLVVIQKKLSENKLSNTLIVKM